MNATPQPQYWIASGGTIIAGPSPIQTIARQRLDGIFPSGTKPFRIISAFSAGTKPKKKPTSPKARSANVRAPVV